MKSRTLSGDLLRLSNIIEFIKSRCNLEFNLQAY